MQRKLVVILGVIGFLLSFPPAYSAESSVDSNEAVSEANLIAANGWESIKGNWYFYKPDGKVATGWLQEKGKSYYFNAAGVMQTGWAKVSNHWYYMNPNGDMAIGWKKIDADWFYLTKSGAMQTGWLELNNKWYLLGGGGQMQTGWIKPNNDWYYMNPNGDMAIGWNKVGTDWFYLTKSGAMKTGWVEVNNTWYFLRGGGQMQTGWINQGNTWYFLSNSGAMNTGWVTDKGNKYHISSSGAMQIGLQTIQDATYYFNTSGHMQTGWIETTGGKYYFNPSNGKAVTGQIMIEGNAYSFDQAGVLQPNAVISGWISDGKHYYYYSASQKKTGWLDLEGKWYYLNETGVMTTNWQLINGKWYFLAANGTMQTGWLNLSGQYYYLNNNGAMQTGWLQLGKWYYLNASGAMLTGQQTINNKVYFFDASGAWTIGHVINYVNYSSTLAAVMNTQLGLSTPPQTDRYKNSTAYVSAAFIELDKADPKKGKTTAVLNVREGAMASSHSYGKLANGATVDIVNTINGWYEINYQMQWQNAKQQDIMPHLDPTTYKEGSTEFNQFLVLSQSADTSVEELNSKVLKGKGILDGQGKGFHDASAAHKINEVYLIAHAMLESGNGTSQLANGVIVNGKKVYNMFGIGAYDSCALECGAQRAYDEGWDTPQKAIVGGAKFVSEKYINHPTYKQDTLYKMRWNPSTPGVHQYATDMEWATKQARIQTRIMNEIYDTLDAYTLYFEVPVYKK